MLNNCISHWGSSVSSENRGRVARDNSPTPIAEFSREEGVCEMFSHELHTAVINNAHYHRSLILMIVVSIFNECKNILENTFPRVLRPHFSQDIWNSKIL